MPPKKKEEEWSKIHRAEYLRMMAIMKARYQAMSTVDLETGICERTDLRGDQELRTGDYEAFIEKACAELVCAEYKEGFREKLSLEYLRKRGKEMRESEDYVVECRMKSGPSEWLELHVLLIRQEDVITAHILERDITEKKQREEQEIQAVKDSNYIISCLSSMYFATYYVDIKTDTFRAVRQREAVEKILGDEINFTEALRAYAGSFIHPDERGEYLRTFAADQLAKTLSPERPFVAFEYRRVECDEDGAEHGNGWVRAAAVAAEFQNGKPKTALYVAQDITESRKKEEREHQTLREACRAANVANTAKTEFLSRMSHDIRTPLNAIIGMTAIAGLNLQDTERVADCLNKITVSGRHLLSLMNEVLDMSKIESGKVDLAEEEFSLSELTDDFLTIMRPAVREKHHTLDVQISGVEHEDVIGDAMRLQRVFVNILGNAVKYTPPGGKLRIEISEKPARSREYGCYEFVFTDNGIGMSEEFQKKIFEPFSRAQDAAIRTVDGTGLGMPIAQNIVRMMNGSIEVDSEPGKGSRFTVTLFLKQKNAVEADLGELKELRVLVVDDEQDSCVGTCGLLSEIGMQGEWVQSGQEAVTRIAERHRQGDDYFVVLLDWKMSGMDGLETARQIRREVGPEVTIIILSAYDWSTVEAEARMAGVDGFISKPLFKSRLIYLFRQLTEKKTDAEEEQLQGAHIAVPDFEGRHVLLAEDNELNREIAEEFIRMTGAVVESVSNGRQALYQYEQSSEGYYDLIFMDIQMPGMNGYETARAIRSLDRKDAAVVPIIAMTANAFRQDVITSRRAGMNAHITKPISLEQIQECMCHYLGKEI